MPFKGLLRAKKGETMHKSPFKNATWLWLMLGLVRNLLSIRQGLCDRNPSCDICDMLPVRANRQLMQRNPWYPSGGWGLYVCLKNSAPDRGGHSQ